MIKLLIFDWDDTVVVGGGLDFYTDHYVTTLNQVGITTTFNKARVIVDDFWGRAPEEVLTAICQNCTPPQELPSTILDVYNHSLIDDSRLDHLHLAPGAYEALSELSQKYTLVVASSGNPKVIKEKLMPRLGVGPFFSEVLTSYDLTDQRRGKPHPDLTLNLLASQKVPPREAVVIGDSTADMRMANSAGVEFVAVLTGQLSREKAEALELEHILPSIAELPALLKNWR